MPKEQASHKFPDLLIRLKRLSNQGPKPKQLDLLGPIRREKTPLVSDEDVRKRAQDIQSLMHPTGPPESENSFFLQSLEIISQGRNSRNKKEQKRAEEAKNFVLAHLFSVSHQIFQEGENKKPGEERRTYDYDTEFLQIQAVLQLLEGNFVEMQTNMGKTSVVLPITTITRSLFAEERSIVFGVNPTLVDKLKNPLDQFISHLPFTEEQTRFETEKLQETNKKPIDFEDRLENDLKTQLKEGVQSPEVKRSVAQLYWEEFLTRPKTLGEAVLKPGFGCVVTDDRGLIFNATSERYLWRRMPQVYSDEIQVIGESPAPYVSTHSEFLVPQEELENMVFLWVVDRFVQQHIKESDFEVEKGRFKLKEEIKDSLVKSLSAVRENKDRRGIKIFGGKMVNPENIRPDLPDNAITRDALHFIAEYIDAGPDFEVKMRKKLRKWWGSLSQSETEASAGGPGSRETLIETTITLFESLKNSPEGTIYFYDERGKLRVRHEYLATYLEGHYLPSDLMIAALAKDGKFQFVDLFPILYSAIQFPTFVDLVLGGNLVATSASLAFTDPWTGKLVKTPFADFLEQITGRKVVVLQKHDQEVKKPPTPLIGERKDLLDEVAIKLTDQHPTLIISWTEDDGQRIFERLIERFPYAKDKIAFVGAKASYVEDPDHPMDRAEIYKGIENGSITFAVSTGETGLGVDIPHPNLRIGIYDLPQTRIQLMQGLSRRRARGNNFFWLIDKNTLEKRSSKIRAKTSRLEQAFGVMSRAQFDSMLADPKQRLRAIFLLLQEGERERLQNFILIDEVEKMFHLYFMPEVIIPTIKALLTSEAANKMAEGKDLSEYLEKERWELIYEFLGLPEDVYWDLLSTLSILTSTPPVNQQQLASRLISEYSKIVKERLNSWVKSRFDFALTKHDLIFAELDKALKKEGIQKNAFHQIRLAQAFSYPVREKFQEIIRGARLETFEVVDQGSGEKYLAIESLEDYREAVGPSGEVTIYLKKFPEGSNKKYALYTKQGGRFVALGSFQPPLYKPIVIDKNEVVHTVPISDKETEGSLLALLKPLE